MTYRVTGAVVALVMLCACSEPAREAQPSAPEAPVETAAADRSALEPVPRPDLAAFAEPVQEQVTEELEILDRLLADPAGDSGELSEHFGLVGRVYHAYGLLEPAEAAYRNAAKLAPRDHRWRYLLGVAAATRGDAEGAVSHLSHALELAPEDLPSILRLADLRFEANRHDAAVELYRRALDLDPDSASAILGLARISAAADNQRAAIDGFERVLELEPEARSVHYLLGLAYRKAGDRQAAERHIAQRGVRGVTFSDPLVDGFGELTSGIGVHLENGVRALGEKRYQESIDEYRAALELEPENLTALRGLGLALASADRHDEAAASFRKMLAIDPDHTLARMELGTTLLESGDLAEAVAQLEAAVGTDPDFRQAHFNLAVAHSKAGRLAEAEGALREVLRIDSRDRQGLYELGVVLDRLGRAEESVATLRRVLELYPSLGLARQRLGDVLARSGDREGALEQFREVIRLEAPDQEKALAHYQIGRIMAARGDSDATIEAFRKALELMPQLHEARLGLGEALMRGQRFEEAAAEFARVVRVEGASIHARRRLAAALIADRQFRAGRDALEQGLAQIPRSAELAHDLARFLALAPDPSLRDGDRALALAEGAFQAEQSLPHAETIAMALAESQRFEEASAWQRRLIQQAESAGLERQLPRLRANLERYENRQPLRMGG